MSTAAKVAGSPMMFSQTHELAPGADFKRLRGRAVAMALFLFLVICGSIWTVYTMQYYDAMDAVSTQQTSGASAAVQPNSH